jgi:lipoprotein NlpI
MRVRTPAILALVLSCATALPASAQQAAWRDCEQTEDRDKRIAGCTRVLANRNETRENRVLAYNNRGNAHSAKGDQAMAIADYGEALKLDARFAWGYSNRGRAHLFSGDAARARADFQQLRKLDPTSLYAALWLDIAERRSGQPGTLEKASAKLDLKAWPGPIVRLFLGRTSPEQALAAANHANPRTKRTRVCELNFYAGELALAQGNKAEARRLLEMAVADCPPGLIETTSARAELAALGAAK